MLTAFGSQAVVCIAEAQLQQHWDLARVASRGRVYTAGTAGRLEVQQSGCTEILGLCSKLLKP